MSASRASALKRIFYFNVIYFCNSRCVFCYSHNTGHDVKNRNELEPAEFIRYLNDRNISSDDRIIINGGEPLLHSSLDDIIRYVLSVGCEVLIYTNGRLLSEIELPTLNRNVRFVIPIHGDEQTHDRITQTSGSFLETLRGMDRLILTQDCLTDLKIIVHNGLAKKIIRDDSLHFLRNIPFNHAVHITKMADTIISRRNKLPSVDNDLASEAVAALVDTFRFDGRPIKIYDACVKNLEWLSGCRPTKYPRTPIVFFKDRNQAREIELHRPDRPCARSCRMSRCCISAVDEYNVLEIADGRVFEELE